jgi:hypothetical protein
VILREKSYGDEVRCVCFVNVHSGFFTKCESPFVKNLEQNRIYKPCPMISFCLLACKAWNFTKGTKKWQSRVFCFVFGLPVLRNGLIHNFFGQGLTNRSYHPITRSCTEVPSSRGSGILNTPPHHELPILIRSVPLHSIPSHTLFL